VSDLERQLGSVVDQATLKSSCDDAAHGMSAMAGVTASYYRALLEQGLPEDFVRRLTADYHSVWWTAQMAMVFRTTTPDA
jgi:hypothetical protein